MGCAGCKGSQQSNRSRAVKVATNGLQSLVSQPCFGPILRCGKLSFVFHATAQYLFNVEVFVGRDVESLRDNAESDR